METLDTIMKALLMIFVPAAIWTLARTANDVLRFARAPRVRDRVLILRRQMD